MARSSFTSDSSRWAAVSGRDPGAEGCFVYCVKTTKIYCRPTCKARLARRANVEYFDNSVGAEVAGYHACKRCQPNLEKFVPNTDRMIHKICTLLDNLEPGAAVPSLDALAAEAGMTKYHFHRSFKKITGMTPRDYALSKSRTVPNGGEGLVNTAENSPPSLAGDSLMSSTVSTPIDGFTPFTSWEPWDLDDIFQFNDLNWQDIQIPELDEQFSEWVAKELPG